MANGKPTISRVEDIPNYLVSDYDDVPEIELEKVKQSFRDNPAKYKALQNATQPSKNFWRNTAFGRTLSGRNKAGGIIRKIGVAALSVGGGLLGVDVGGVIDSGQDMAQLVQVLDTIETIAWIIAGIVGTLAGGTDYIEVKGEKYDEQEILEGKVPGMRKIKQKIKR